MCRFCEIVVGCNDRFHGFDVEPNFFDQVLALFINRDNVAVSGATNGMDGRILMYVLYAVNHPLEYSYDWSVCKDRIYRLGYIMFLPHLNVKGF